jgi:hypothetical protein
MRVVNGETVARTALRLLIDHVAKHHDSAVDISEDCERCQDAIVRAVMMPYRAVNEQPSTPVTQKDPETGEPYMHEVEKLHKGIASDNDLVALGIKVRTPDGKARFHERTVAAYRTHSYKITKKLQREIQIELKRVNEPEPTPKTMRKRKTVARRKAK